MTPDLIRRSAAEAIGTCLLVATVVGSGIMAERLAGGNVAVALLANTLATVFGLFALILTFGPISGAHFNPVVTLVEVLDRRIPASTLGAYVGSQITGGLAGAVLANVLFGLAPIGFSTHERSGFIQALSEFVATLGLLVVIRGTSATRPDTTPFAVAAFIGAAYWFTPSTSFANPAVTLARSLTNTFAGIRPVDVAGFIGAQVAAALVARPLIRFLQNEKGTGQ